MSRSDETLFPFDVWDIIAENSDIETILALCAAHPDLNYLCDGVNSPLWSKLMERDFPGVEIKLYTGDIEPENLKAQYELLLSRDYWLGLIEHEERDLKFANLQSTDLSFAFLPLADLRFANLRGANLQEANLPHADLQGANLKNAYLVRTGLMKSNLSEADLQRANLEDANLRGANLQYADLRDAILDGANLGGANLQDSDLRRARLMYTIMPDAYRR